ncbi:hypothetical protein ABB37_04852 [Leptomonas pyrrhocoris]|uniref:Uncharacterized protein n=1 Tax=Leptomonas pyrrhocoris TaxID=157538 RepID=A0A0N1J4U9_LEPPY|nr:hypothetical protein ABB37_04852 [Leptomonas pyrrhocoris]KPA80671.1 hypothetical protein ABB37_04852 [Leptomonas pyrrhocoris]|eukprot:XP_015659110.1 hypothetical protein ABB37_04852 [Leptomonas pyrrhocoris]
MKGTAAPFCFRVFLDDLTPYLWQACATVLRLQTELLPASRVTRDPRPPPPPSLFPLQPVLTPFFLSFPFSLRSGRDLFLKSVVLRWRLRCFLLSSFTAMQRHLYAFFLKEQRRSSPSRECIFTKMEACSAHAHTHMNVFQLFFLPSFSVLNDVFVSFFILPSLYYLLPRFARWLSPFYYSFSLSLSPQQHLCLLPSPLPFFRCGAPLCGCSRVLG